MREVSGSPAGSPAKEWGRIAAGGALLAAGVVLLVLPGPGLPLCAAGIAMLASRFAWARSLRDRAASVLRSLAGPPS